MAARPSPMSMPTQQQKQWGQGQQPGMQAGRQMQMQQQQQQHHHQQQPGQPRGMQMQQQPMGGMGMGPGSGRAGTAGPRPPGSHGALPRVPEELQCPDRFCSLTTSAMPASKSLHNKLRALTGMIVTPLANSPGGPNVSPETSAKSRLPVVDFGEVGIVRCRECRAYINPFATFMDSGRKWRCNFCGMENEVKSGYFQHLGDDGRSSLLLRFSFVFSLSFSYLIFSFLLPSPPLPSLQASVRTGERDQSCPQAPSSLSLPESTW